jgi:hypothetical protein
MKNSFRAGSWFKVDLDSKDEDIFINFFFITQLNTSLQRFTAIVSIVRGKH